jgi:hypothetical protein
MGLVNLKGVKAPLVARGPKFDFPLTSTKHDVQIALQRSMGISKELTYRKRSWTNN